MRARQHPISISEEGVGSLPLQSQDAVKNGSSPTNRTSSPTRSSIKSSSPRRSAIPRKLLCRLIARNLHQRSSGNPFVDFIKDIALGTICGVMFILFLSFLDYRNILSVGSRGRLRAAAYELITDPEWMRTIEETIDVRFVDMDIYNAIQKEITHDPTDTPFYRQKIEEMKMKEMELEDAKKERDELISKLGINLNQWCGGCKGGWGFCEGRVQYLRQTYGTSETILKINLMKTGQCILPSG